MNPVRVLLLDEQRSSIDITRAILDSTSELDLVGEVSNPLAVHQTIRSSKPDVLLVNPKSRIARVFNKQSASLDIPTVNADVRGEDPQWHSTALHKVSKTKLAEDIRRQIISAVFGGKDLKEGESDSLFTQSSGKTTSPLQELAGSRFRHAGPEPLVVVATPNGDLDAVKSLILGLQPNAPGIVIAQNVPASFERFYLNSLKEVSGVSVFLAKDGDSVTAGEILVLPAKQPARIHIKNKAYVCDFSTGALPSNAEHHLDYLLDSLDKSAGTLGVGVLMLGAGTHGVQGLTRLKQLGIDAAARFNDLDKLPMTSAAAILTGDSQSVVSMSEIATEVKAIFSKASS